MAVDDDRIHSCTSPSPIICRRWCQDTEILEVPVKTNTIPAITGENSERVLDGQLVPDASDCRYFLPCVGKGTGRAMF